MTDKIRQFLEKQQSLARLTDPLYDLRSQLDKIANPYPSTFKSIKAATAQYSDISKLVNAATGQYSDVFKSVNAATEVLKTYESQFRLPTFPELTGIAHEAMKYTNLARTILGTEDRLSAAMAEMHSPWLHSSESLASANAFSEIVAIGRGLNSSCAFNSDFAALLRSGLGDWRDITFPEPQLFLDSSIRSEFYTKRGFNPRLADFPFEAFDETLEIAELRVSKHISTQRENQQSERAKEAYNQLRELEVALRRFIMRVMQAQFGDGWMKQQLPPDMYDKWFAKREKAVKGGCTEEELIEYADFTDYIAIIERRDNWSAVFKPVFIRSADVRESLQRLYPVRIATMHARPIEQDDELLLVVEIKRIMKAINAKQK